MSQFNYDLAFSRNQGITTGEQQTRLKNATFAIAGMGGVGGDYLITLARVGVGNFKISDFDEFEMGNFNRQYGATMSTVGHDKMAVMQKLALDINPEATITTYGTGIHENNVDDFLTGVDVFVDAVEFFEIGVHRLILNACRTRGIPAVLGVPMGFGVGVLVFTPEGMSFDDYFDIDYQAPLGLQALKMALAAAPAGFHLKYIQPDAFDLDSRKAPSIASGCKLATGIVITKAILALLHPHELKPIPHYICYDARINRLKNGYLWNGNRNPLQRLKFFIARKKLGI
ncbi:MAG: thiamine biosynthesis protein ThiF [Gammaproteobacteria bacterium HGW-Gammaproteobacteria-3]|jgi:molybdopterin/thiamine biosynthesis adenylyltransferase|nr:MAG: thiamine biosynthesis protein ThiF [Gammaproteobacteria bacterium HGW-Gammaproteobacteria-3]